MNLDIDYREDKIIELINKEKNKCNLGPDFHIKTKSCNEICEINTTVKGLILGDFIIRHNNSEEILFIIERKSIDDLCSSIKDNRFREQKSRLLESIKDPSKIIYIIEGNKKLSKRLPLKTLNSAILNLIIKHNFKVIYTSDYQDTLDNLLLLCKKTIDKQNGIEGFTGETPTLLIKKSDVLNNNIMINMLSVIPGVSINTAKKINEKYSNLSKLYLAYHLIEQQEQIPENSKISKLFLNALKNVYGEFEILKEDLLSEIQITDKRKLGKALSKKIYYALFYDKTLDIKKLQIADNIYDLKNAKAI